MLRKGYRAILAAFALAPALFALAGCTPPIHEVRMTKPVWLETTRQEKLILDVRNASGLEFPLEEKIKQALISKGYVLVPLKEPKKADMIVRVLVEYVGLEYPAYSGQGAAGGAIIGGGAGALGGVAAAGHSSDVALGALAGAVLGAGIGALAEKMDNKEIFTARVALRVENSKDETKQETPVTAKIREHDLTYEKAINSVADQIASCISGVF